MSFCSMSVSHAVHFEFLEMREQIGHAVRIEFLQIHEELDIKI